MLSSAFNFLNEKISENLTPVQTIGLSLLAPLAVWAYQHDWLEEREKWQKRLFRMLPYIPKVKDELKRQLDKDFEPALDALDESIHKKRKLRYRELPNHPQNKAMLLKAVEEIAVNPSISSKISGAIYRDRSDKDLDELNAQIFRLAGYTNPLHGDLWPDIKQCENEVVAWVAQLFKGDPNNIMGNITTGGTDSIAEAMYTYREWAKDQKEMQVINDSIATISEVTIDLRAQINDLKMRQRTLILSGGARSNSPNNDAQSEPVKPSKRARLYGPSHWMCQK